MKSGSGIASASVFCIAAALQPVSAHAEDAQANRLMVEAAELLSESSEASLGKRYGILEAALSRVDRIIEDHPESSLAVKLATGQSIGFVEPIQLREEVEHYAQVLDMSAALDSLNDEMKHPEKAFGAQSWRVYTALAALDAGLPDLGDRPDIDVNDAIDSFQATSFGEGLDFVYSHNGVSCMASVVDATVVGRSRAQALRLLDRLRGSPGPEAKTIIPDEEWFDRIFFRLRIEPDFMAYGRQGISLWDSAMREAGFELRSGRTATQVWEDLSSKSASRIEEVWPDRSAAALEDMSVSDLGRLWSDVSVVDLDAATSLAHVYAERIDLQRGFDGDRFLSSLYAFVSLGEKDLAVDLLNAINISSIEEFHRMTELSCWLLGYPADEFGNALMHWLARETWNLDTSTPDLHAMLRQVQINAFILSRTESRN
jgi:hypothetical protein